MLQYIAAMRDLIVFCEFGTVADEMIENQLIEKTNITERLLLESELSLEKAVTIETQIETAVAEARIRSLETGGEVQSVDSLHTAEIQAQGYSKKMNGQPQMGEKNMLSL